MLIIYLLYGIVAGYFSGILGIGAGCMLMPFYVVVGVPYEIAVDSSLMAVLASSLSSTIQNSRTSGIPMEPSLIMAIPGGIFAVIGNCFLIHVIPTFFLEIIYAGLMFLNVDLLRLTRKRQTIPVDMSQVNHKDHFFLYITIGSLVGLTASLLGIGGGIFIIPLLIIFANFSVKDSVKIAVVVMVFTTFFSLISEIFSSTLPWNIGVPSAIGAVIGSFFGTIALKYVNQAKILKINYSVSFSLGAIMLLQVLLNSL